MEFEVRFLPSDRRVRVLRGATLLEAARRAELPVASACGAAALCGRCGLEVLGGAERLDGETPEEMRAKRRNRAAPGLRLACRTAVVGDLEVSAPYW